MYTALSLSDHQVEFLRESLGAQLGNIKSEIRRTNNAQMKIELKHQKEDIEDMLIQIEGKEITRAA